MSCGNPRERGEYQCCLGFASHRCVQGALRLLWSDGESLGTKFAIDPTLIVSADNEFVHRNRAVLCCYIFVEIITNVLGFSSRTASTIEILLPPALPWASGSHVDTPMTLRTRRGRLLGPTMLDIHVLRNVRCSISTFMLCISYPSFLHFTSLDTPIHLSECATRSTL